MQVLASYINEHCPPATRPLILLDSVRCHMMANVVAKIQQFGVEVMHIQGGCTCNVQPVDVGIGKPLKDRVRRHWDQWLLAHADTAAIFQPPSKETLATWIIDSLNDLPQTLVQNAWLSSRFSYYP